MVLIVFLFISVTQAFYTFRNIDIFENQFQRMTKSQAYELGKMIENYFSIPISLEIPLERIGGVEKYLQEVIETAPIISFIQIIKNEQIIFSVEVVEQYDNLVTVPIHDKNKDRVEAEIRIGVLSNVEESSNTLLIDLVTIIVACLVYTYELLIFLASFVIIVPGTTMISELNRSMLTLQAGESGKGLSMEFRTVLMEMERKVVPMRNILSKLLMALETFAARVKKTKNEGKKAALDKIARYQNEIRSVIGNNISHAAVVVPSHVRPIVATFVLAANLQSSFLPVFTEELLSTPTLIDPFFPREILIGLPITLYMLTVTASLMALGSSYCAKLKPYHALLAGLVVAALGFVVCGFSVNIIHLILGRMLCAVGFSMIVFYCRKFIVDNSSPDNRTVHLAGYTAAFSGGMLCSIVVGAIITEYFSYQAVFFLSAAMMIIVLKFAHMVFGDYDPELADLSLQQSGKREKQGERKKAGFGFLFRMLLKDGELFFIFIQGIMTRVIFIGLFYYTVPIFLKKYFSFSDVGRIMMFYSLSSIVLSTWLNRYVKGIRGSIWGIFIANMVLGLSMGVFVLLELSSTYSIVLASIGVLMILGIANSVTFPSQVNLLLETHTVHEMGSHTPMALFQSIERVGSALGPVVFGLIAIWLDTRHTIAVVGGMSIVSSLMFLVAFRKKVS